jgi:hypothetical protein
MIGGVDTFDRNNMVIPVLVLPITGPTVELFGWIDGYSDISSK